MGIKPIFVDDSTGEGLYAMLYDGEDNDEFERLFDLWDDTEYVTEYLIKNLNFLKTDHFEGADLDDIISKVLKEAEELEYLLEDYFYDSTKNLQMLFIPLNNNEYSLPNHQKTKAKIDNRKYFPKPILRVYGIRINANTFVITGGAIKLVEKMNQHLDTIKELEKLDIVKKYLKENDFDFEEDFKIIV